MGGFPIVGRFLDRLTGLRAMVASAFLFAVMAALIKAASETIPSGQVVFVRNAIHVAMFLPLWWFTTDRKLVKPGLLFLRGLLGLGALEIYAWTLGVMPLADAWMLQSMNPFFVAVLAPWILGETSPARVWLALALGLVGAALIVRPGFDHEWVPGLVGLLGGLLAGSAYMTVRALGKSERPLAVVTAMPVIGLPLSAPWGIAVWHTPTVPEWALLLAIALTGAGGQIMMTVGLKGAKAAPAATATYVGFAFAAAIAWLVFYDPPAWTTVAGAAAVFAALTVVSGRVKPRPAGVPATVPTGTEEM
jgi:drug/metabolite transporter (DMT)-like permease